MPKSFCRGSLYFHAIVLLAVWLPAVVVVWGPEPELTHKDHHLLLGPLVGAHPELKENCRGRGIRIHEILLLWPGLEPPGFAQ